MHFNVHVFGGDLGFEALDVRDLDALELQKREGGELGADEGELPDDGHGDEAAVVEVDGADLLQLVVMQQTKHHRVHRLLRLFCLSEEGYLHVLRFGF